ncbi:uncharacterized protein LOC120827417 isoform X4 [Gasterosteus aculeatus]
MIEEIKSGSSRSFASGKLRELCKLLPDEGEEKQLVSFKGDHSALPEADLFMLMLVQIPSYEERLSSLVLKEEFFPLMNDMKECIGTLSAAGKELLESDNLHSVIRLVLKTGNYMNAGGYAGSAVGFRMASLLKLVDTKANKPGMNLMHYVVMQALKVDMELLKFTDQLKHIEAAARMNKSEIEAEFDKQVIRVQSAKADTLKQEDLKEQMEDFLKEAEVCLAEIETDLQELQSVSDSVAEYFCENPTTFKLEECFSIFNSFCERFMRAMQENKAREVAEVKRRHRERLQIASKRRSTATCSSRDKEMDGVALQSILQNFLTKGVPQRRTGRPSSAYEGPAIGSPDKGSLSGMTCKVDLPAGKQLRGFKSNDMFRKEWNSAAELTENLSQKDQSDGEECWAKGGIQNEEDGNISRKEEPADSTQPTGRTTGVSPAGRSFSAATDDSEEDLQDNNEDEAQTLREASKKVLRFQNSRSSVSSDDHYPENQKSPGASTRLPRQRTVDQETDRYPEDPTNNDLVQFLLNPQTSSKRNLGRRHTLPTKVPKTEGDEHDLFALPPVRTPHSAKREKGTVPAEGSSKQVFDFTETSHNFQKCSAQDQNSVSEEKPSKPNVSDGDAHGPQDEVGESGELTDSPMQSNAEEIPPKSTQKTENSGLFFYFLKRLGDLSKVQNSKETVHKGNDSAV